MAGWIVAIVLFWIVCGFVAARIRQGRPDDGSNWFLNGFLLGPLGVLLALAPGGDLDPDQRTCVHCGKIVARGRQRFCNHCGEPFAA